jgi:hypothetical protein
VLALLGLGACATTWRPASGADPAASLRAASRAASPVVVRVTVTGWPEPVLVRAPQVVGDSLVGSRLTLVENVRGPRLAVPLTAITRVEERRGDAGGTGVLVVVGLLGAALFGLAIAASGYRN